MSLRSIKDDTWPFKTIASIRVWIQSIGVLSPLATELAVVFVSDENGYLAKLTIAGNNPIFREISDFVDSQDFARALVIHGVSREMLDPPLAGLTNRGATGHYFHTSMSSIVTVHPDDAVEVFPRRRGPHPASGRFTATFAYFVCRIVTPPEYRMAHTDGGTRRCMKVVDISGHVMEVCEFRPKKSSADTLVVHQVVVLLNFVPNPREQNLRPDLSRPGNHPVAEIGQTLTSGGIRSGTYSSILTVAIGDTMRQLCEDLSKTIVNATMLSAYSATPSEVIPVGHVSLSGFKRPHSDAA